ncbi:hypothetical protein JYT20_01325 [Rhodothermus sp. AH-315-K08]|nr:hypothetical protein [Rhodothermus sp. AH-315-K08]
MLRNLSFVFLLALGAGALAGCGDSPPPVQERVEYAAGDSVVFIGSLVGARCYGADRANIGADHPRPIPTSQEGAGCAKYCLRQGFPAGLIVRDDSGTETVWMLLAIPPVLGDYVATAVRVHGTVRSPGVLVPDRIEQEREDGSWSFIL